MHKQENHGTGLIGLRAIRTEFDSLAIIYNRLAVIVILKMGKATVIISLSRAGIEFYSPVKIRNDPLKVMTGYGGFIFLKDCYATIVIGLPVRGIKFDGLIIVGDGFIVLVTTKKGISTI